LGPLSVLNHKAMREQSSAMLATTRGQDSGHVESLAWHVGWPTPMRGHRTCGRFCQKARSSWTSPPPRLGVRETARVEQIIKGLKQRGVPLIIISHNLRQVFDLIDRL